MTGARAAWLVTDVLASGNVLIRAVGGRGETPQADCPGRARA